MKFVSKINLSPLFDEITGGDGDGSIFGGGGDDIISGDQGLDQISGGDYHYPWFNVRLYGASAMYTHPNSF